MIHVVVDANCLAWGWGGIPKVVDRVVRELVAREDVRVDLLANTSAPFARIPGVREAHRRIRGTAAWRETFLARWLEHERPSVFWAPEGILPRRVRTPSVVTIHDLAPLLFRGVKPWRHGLAFRTAVPRSVRAATRVVTVSQTTAADVIRLYGTASDRVTVVPNGVDDRFTPGSRDAARLLLSQRRGLDGPFVAAVGSLEPRKGLDVLLDAAEASAARRLPWRVVLVGSTGYRGGDLAARARSTPGCEVLGPVDDEELTAVYRAAEAVVTPSLYEGFGLTPLEALACGTPAIVSAGSGGLVEVAGAAGAVVVEERSGTAWVEAIERARADRDAIAARAAPALAGYRWPAVAERMLAVFERAARGR